MLSIATYKIKVNILICDCVFSLNKSSTIDQYSKKCVNIQNCIIYYNKF